MEKYYNDLLKKYQIQKDTLRTLSEHEETTDAEKSKLYAVIRFIEAFEKDVRDLKALPF